LSNKQSSTPIACSEKIAKLTPSPVQLAPSGYGFPGQALIVVIKRVVLISHDMIARNLRFACGSTEFVAQKNSERPKTDRSRDHERAGRRIGQGQEEEERLHCFGHPL
jgi:hypothetical protein